MRHGRVDLNESCCSSSTRPTARSRTTPTREVAKVYKETALDAADPRPDRLARGVEGEDQRDNAQTLFIEHVEARTEEDEDVKPYVEQTEFEGRKVALPHEYNQLLSTPAGTSTTRR